MIKIIKKGLVFLFLFFVFWGCASAPVAQRDFCKEFEDTKEVIYFKYGSAELNTAAKESIKKYAQYSICCKKRFELFGQADESEDETNNLNLSIKRAVVVRDYLLKLGLGAGDVKTIAHGSENRIKKENSSEVNANKYVEILIYDK